MRKPKRTPKPKGWYGRPTPTRREWVPLHYDRTAGFKVVECLAQRRRSAHDPAEFPDFRCPFKGSGGYFLRDFEAR